MPWKGEKNPYKIWLSEIILQQTQVAQGIGYYNRFIEKYPTIFDLAAAEDREVFKLWEGLGYYNRCKNLLFTARYLVNMKNGQFPSTFNELMTLKGIGAYTASAISSFAFNLPNAVLDGNVFRVLSRFFGIYTAIDTNEGKKIFASLANNLLDKKNAGVYNQSIMDFGATVCKSLPLCTECLINTRCEAFLKNLVDTLPAKEKKVIRTHRWIYFLIIEYEGRVYTRKRTANDIWQNLYEFIKIDPPTKLPLKQLRSGQFFESILNGHKYFINKISAVQQQLLTHQVVKGRFITISIKTPLLLEGYELVTKRELRELPFPKFITTYLKE